jgi:peroxiredoxin
MKPLPYAWIAAGILFAGATVWINYEVKVNLQTDDHIGSTRKLGEINVGQAAPDFAAQDLSQQTVTLASFRGQKVVVLDFWATWCGPCRMAMPGLQTLQDEFKGRGVEFLSINQGESPEQAGDFMSKKGYGFHVLLDPDSSIGAQYGVQGIPTLMAVDKQGVVRWIRVGYLPSDADLKRMLEKLVSQ